MKPSRFPLGRFFRPRIDDARLARQWSRIDDRLQTRSRTLRLLPRVAAILAFAFIVLVVSMPRPVQPPPSAVDGAVLETAAGQEQTLTLPEGSRIALEGATRVRLARVARDDVRLELERGAVRLAVTHVEGRRFVVAAREIAVRVVGTRFRVALDGESTSGGTVAVVVEEGRVEVARGVTTAATISAGEMWSAPLAAPAIAPIAEPSVAPSTSTSTAPKRPAIAKRRLGATFHERFRDGDYAGAFALVESEDFPTLVKSLDPHDLLALSVASRLSGHPRRAALSLDRLRKAFRSDPRAGIAALDLGRLRLDELNDAQGALDALDDAMSLPLSDALKEDAEARRVQALERLGDIAACVAARDEYLLHHPEGVHTTSIARRCKSP
ncbi:MAG: FecR domain-containing protein [Deltaproteobacteria bacterium]|nr:FecR domain-containing protein [Deltaproteobacteria bacterium]